MRIPRIVFALTATLLFTASNTQAEELLTSGDFETPGGFDLPGWSLDEFVSGTLAPINSAQTSGSGFSGETGDGGIWFRAHQGGPPLRVNQANFDDDNLPAGDVDGRDFLIMQRGVGLASPLPEEGDSAGGEGGVGDGVVDNQDFNEWQFNFGQSSVLTNAVLSQTVPASEGTTYVFTGASRWEANYSGGVTTLDADGPFGAISSPTSTTFDMEFLNAQGDVIGSESLDLRTVQFNINFWDNTNHIVNGVAPTGTAAVRVAAAARDMAWNGVADNGGNQGSFVDHFSLTTTADPNTELLMNPDLDDDVPDALDFWNPVELPETREDILRTEPQFGFASRPASGGTRGVWVSAFFGAHEAFEPDPVDATISQTVDIVSGGTYTFSGWMKFERNYSGGVDTISSTGGTGTPGFFAGQPSPTTTEIILAFLDSEGAVISEAVIDVKAERQALAPDGNANNQTIGPDSNGWTEHTLTAVAPENAVQARLSAEMLQLVYNANPQQSMFADDFSLDGPVPTSLAAVPEPASIVCLAMGLAALAGRRFRGT